MPFRSLRSIPKRVGTSRHQPASKRFTSPPSFHGPNRVEDGIASRKSVASGQPIAGGRDCLSIGGRRSSAVGQEPRPPKIKGARTSSAPHGVGPSGLCPSGDGSPVADTTGRSCFGPPGPDAEFVSGRSTQTVSGPEDRHFPCRSRQAPGSAVRIRFTELSRKGRRVSGSQFVTDFSDAHTSQTPGERSASAVSGGFRRRIWRLRHQPP